jgi:hypothetical protein
VAAVVDFIDASPALHRASVPVTNEAANVHQKKPGIKNTGERPHRLFKRGLCLVEGRANRNPPRVAAFRVPNKETQMNSIIYLVGLVVIVLFILSFLGLR